MYYPRQLVYGASFSLTVAPILWGTRVCFVLTFLGLISVFGFFFFNFLIVLEPCLTGCDLRPLVVYPFPLISHSSPRASRCSCVSSLPWEFLVSICSVDLVIASVHSFGGCLLFYCVIWVFVLFFIRIPPCLVLGLDYMVHVSLWVSFDLRDCLSIWGLIVCFHWVDLLIFSLLLSHLKFLFISFHFV